MEVMFTRYLLATSSKVLTFPGSPLIHSLWADFDTEQPQVHVLANFPAMAVKDVYLVS